MSDKATPVVAYIRVSDGKSSIERQRGDLADAVREDGLTVLREFTDEGISASLYGTKVREDYEVLVALIRSGEADGQTIWLSEASRMTRNVEVFAPLRRLCREHGVRWWIDGRIYDLTIDKDLSSVTRMVAAAEHEVIVLSGRVRSGIREQVRDQRPHGTIPYGYTRAYAGRGRFASQDPHPVSGPIVTELATRYAAGESPATVAADLAERGVPTPGSKPWTGQNVVRLATSIVYTGRRRYRGKQVALIGTHEGCWPALVDEETHMAAVARAEGARKGQAPRKSENLMVGIAHCWRCPRGVPSPVGYIYAVDRDGRRVYRCLKGCVQLPQSDVDIVVLRVLAELFLRDSFAALFAPGESADLAAARVRLATAQAEWEELAAAPLSPAMVARREPPLLAAIEKAKAEVRAHARPSTLGALVKAKPTERMAVFLGQDLAVQRVMLADMVDVTLKARGPAGRTKPVVDYVNVVARHR